MTEVTDVRQGSVRFANRVTAAGHTQIPNVVMCRPDLSVGAKLVYGYLSHIAWRAERNGGGVEPPIDVIARDLNVSVRTVHTYIGELRAAPANVDDSEGPKLVVSERRGLGLTNAYVINDPILQDGSANIADPESRNVPIPARARSLPEDKRSTEEGRADALPAASAKSDQPPKLMEIDGQNLGFNALRDVCKITKGDKHGEREVAAALNGSRTLPGIRPMIFDELVKSQFGGDAAAAHAEVASRPADFERAVVAMIERRAKAFATSWPEITMTPLALRKWWLRLDALAATGNGGMTPEQIRNMG